ncbi:MAG: cobalamin biosynthesis protein CbiG [Roseomonas sp.]|nr:cobalamin biosynthesis protein CbiG [Roseomonas sp.]
MNAQAMNRPGVPPPDRLGRENARPHIVAGLGCRAQVTAGAVLEILRDAQRGMPPFTHLAAPEFRRGMAVLEDAARSLGLPLVFIGRPALEAVQPRCPTRSEAALRATGLASVAEACALAAAGEGAMLLAPRRGGAGVTCAVAAGSAA